MEETIPLRKYPSGEAAAKHAMKTVKEDLLRWICERHATNSPLDRKLLRDKARELTIQHKLNEFKCSEGWLTVFLKKYGFSPTLTTCTGPVFPNYQTWVNLMRPLIVQYKYRDLFHVDELTMFSDIFPTRISILEQYDLDPRTNRVAALICCNSSGTEKLPLLICGSYPVQSPLKKRNHLYCYAKDAWINDELFREWLSRLNNHMSRGNRRILLLLHRSRISALKGLELSNVNLVFFPKDYPAMLRPLRRDVFHCVKTTYRRRYAERLSTYPNWKLNDVVNTLIESWNKVPQELIIASFQRTHFRMDDCFLQIDCHEWDRLNMGISFKRFVTFDDDLSDDPSLNQFQDFTGNRSHGYNLRNSRREIDKSNETYGESGRKEEVQERDFNKSINFQEFDGRRGKNLKRTYGEIELIFPSNNQTVNEDENVNQDESVLLKNSENPMDLEIVEDQKTDEIKDVGKMPNYSTNSVQEIIDCALASTSTAKTEYVKRMINEIYASNERKIPSKEESKLKSVETITDESTEALDCNQNLQTDFNEKDILQIDLENVKEIPEASRTSIKTVSLSSGSQSDPEELTRSQNVDLIRSGSFKRRRSDSNFKSPEELNVEEPATKRSKADYDWSKQYENKFVFGPPILPEELIDMENASGVDYRRSSNRSQQGQSSTSVETEKRSIFTMNDRSGKPQI